jgi:hypothetical protein
MKSPDAIDSKNSFQRISFQYLLVPQEHTMGCAVACLASRCGLSYKKALTLFDNAENAWTRGFFCEEIVNAFNLTQYRYAYEEFDLKKHLYLLEKEGTIAFIAPCEAYPLGHFILRVGEGWMNPWSNYPQLVPVESSIQKNIAWPVSFIIYEQKNSEYP